MSSSQSRQVAKRVFAEEYNDATYTFKESDDDMAPKFALLPTGPRVNRVFIVGTLTEADDISDENEYWQARVVDPTGVFYVYAGQYQPEVMAFLRDAEPPMFVSVTGKVSTYETDDGNKNVTVRPENMAIVDADTKKRWVQETALQTLDRIEAFRAADPQSDDCDEDIYNAVTNYGDQMDNYLNAVDDALDSIED